MNDFFHDEPESKELAEAPKAQFVEQSKSMMEQIALAKEQARYTVALKYPRNIETVRLNMLKECSRPSFVMPDEKKNGSSVAWYKLPKGGGIEGFTVRFAEMARQAWGHTFVDIVPVGEDETQRIFQLSCTDYQTNNGGTEIVTVAKTVERQKLKPTDTVISQRTNSRNETVYTIIGTDDDLMAKRNALNSKAKRNLLLELIPGWLKEECRLKMLETARKRDAEDPDAAKRKLFDAFATVGVTPQMLEEFLGHKNPTLSPQELEDLRGYFGAMHEGYTTWAEIVAAKGDGQDDEQAKQIEQLLTASGRTPAQARKLKGQYIGRNGELLKFLQDESAKKADTGAATTAKQETAKAEATKQPVETRVPEEVKEVAQQQVVAEAQKTSHSAPPPISEDW